MITGIDFVLVTLLRMDVQISSVSAEIVEGIWIKYLIGQLKTLIWLIDRCDGRAFETNNERWLYY